MRTQQEHKDEEDHATPAIAIFFQKEMGVDINPAGIRELGDLVKEFSPDRVEAAIIAAALHQVESPLPYVRTVLENEREGNEKLLVGPLGNQNVRMNAEELMDLVKRFGKVGAGARIEALTLYKASTGRAYKSDYSTILLWENRGNPDGTAWDPAPPDSWHINEAWLLSHTPGGATPAPSLGPGVAGGRASGGRSWAPVTCQRCGEEFLAKIPKSRPPVSVCQKCARAENADRRARLTEISLRIGPSPFKYGNFVIGGCTSGGGGSRPFGSIILGLPAKEGLRWVGNVGSGFKRSLQELYECLQTITIEESPFEPGTNMTKLEKYGVSWVRPVLVAEVKYREITRAGKLLSSSFRCLRPDLKPEDCGAAE